MSWPDGLILPGTGLYFSGISAVNPSFTGFTFDASNDGVEFIFSALEAMTITELGVRPQTVTGSQPTYELRLEGVTAGGRADGTVKSSGGAKGNLPTMTAGEWEWVTLGSSYTCARGELLALVIAYVSGTIDGSNNVAFTYRAASTNDYAHPKAVTVNSGTGSDSSSGHPVFGYASAQQSYGFPIETMSTNVTISTTNEAVLVFTLPSNLLTSYKVAGLRVQFRTFLNTGSNAIRIKLYDSDLTTVLQQTDFDIDYFGGIATGQRVVELPFSTATLSALRPGVKYYASVLTTANTCTLFRWDLDRVQDLDAWPGGRNFYLATGNSGAWSEVTTGRPSFDLMLDDAIGVNLGHLHGRHQQNMLVVPRTASFSR